MAPRGKKNVILPGQTRIGNFFIPATAASPAQSAPTPPPPLPAAPTLPSLSLKRKVDEEDDDDDDDDEEEEEEKKEPEQTGTFLMHLWNKPAGKKTGQRGRPAKSGQAQIKECAERILEKAVPKANPVAEALGLGPCQIVQPTNQNRTTTRPTEVLSAQIGHAKRKTHWILSYHLTWSAENGPPPGGRGLEYGHRCHESCCVNPKHGVWQSGPENRAANGCKDEGNPSHYIFDDKHMLRICKHQPECLAGIVIKDMNHPNIVPL